jgi:hypothetical protein
MALSRFGGNTVTLVLSSLLLLGGLGWLRLSFKEYIVWKVGAILVSKTLA